MFAIDESALRYALGGVLLEFHADGIIAVSTDGRRLAKHEVAASVVGNHGQHEDGGCSVVIVPGRAVRLLLKLLPTDDELIKLVATPNDIRVATPGMMIVSRLLEGRFPRWRDVIPKRTDAVHLTLDMDKFHAVLRQASIVTSEDSRGIGFSLDADTLTLDANTAEVGSACVAMEVVYSGQPIAVCLDNTFVAEFCKAIAQDSQVSVEVSDDGGAAVFRAGAYEYVVMPLSKD